MVEIFGTLGPSCREVSILRRMLEEGMTGMRLNLSHTSLSDSAGLLENYREAQRQSGIMGDLLIDLQGPELRIGALKEELQLRNGDKLLLRPNKAADVSAADVEATDVKAADVKTADVEEGSSLSIVVDHPVYIAVDAGDTILLDDGAIELKVLKKGSDTALTKVVRGGRLSGKKSIKIVGKSVRMPVLTMQDIENIRCAPAYGVTALMQPFVTSGEQLKYIREILSEQGLEGIRLFAKIESREGAEALEDILPWADVIVIARGDLGNDVPLWELPGLQKDIAKVCRDHGKAFLVVTQMLASMIQSPIPTRAEVSDIFNAVLDGASAVMVTNETAVGKYPVEVIRYMKMTCQTAENWNEPKAPSL